MKRIGVVFAAALLCYAYAFNHVDAVYATDEKAHLTAPPSMSVIKATLPYLQQLTGEVLYVKTAVYIGSVIKHKLNIQPELLANNFETMQKVHPYLFDVYHMENAYMRDMGDPYVKRSIAMLKDGMIKLPNEWRLPFYIAFNYFYVLKDNSSAYQYLHKATELSGNKFFSHLASVLSAKDGELKAGIIWLKALYENETVQIEREGLLKDIQAYEKAIMVQNKVYQYKQIEGSFPTKLENLIPNYLPSLPAIEAKFEILYDDELGLISLQRPRKST